MKHIYLLKLHIFKMATRLENHFTSTRNDNMKNNKFIRGAKNTFDDYNIQILQRNKK